jgi:hypothetical protein
MRKIGISRFSFEETSFPGSKPSIAPVPPNLPGGDGVIRKIKSLQFTSLAERW